MHLETLNIYLIFGFFQYLKSTAILKLRRKLPALRTLKTSQLALSLAASYRDLARAFPSLHRVWICGGAHALIEEFLIHCSHLDTIEILHSRLMLSVLRHLPTRLSRLTITLCDLYNGGESGTFPLTHLSQMTSLVLTGSVKALISNERLTQMLRCMPRLARFFAPCTLDETAISTMIDHCPALTSLALTQSQTPISVKTIQKVLDTYRETLTELRLSAKYFQNGRIGSLGCPSDGLG